MIFEFKYLVYFKDLPKTILNSNFKLFNKYHEPKNFWKSIWLEDNSFKAHDIVTEIYFTDEYIAIYLDAE